MRYAVTGPRFIDLEQEFLVERVVRGLPDLEELVSGCAEGVDTVCVGAAFMWTAPDDPRSSARIRLTVPRVMVNGVPNILPCNGDLLALAPARGWIVEYGFPGRDASDGYLKRDDLTVARGECLLAFPKTGEEEQRSGTWATLRRARRTGMEIRAYPLNGDASWVESARPKLF